MITAFKFSQMEYLVSTVSHCGFAREFCNDCVAVLVSGDAIITAVIITVVLASSSAFTSGKPADTIWQYCGPGGCWTGYCSESAKS